MSIVNDLIALMLQMEDAEDAEIVRAFAKRFDMGDDDLGYITGYLQRDDAIKVRELLGVTHPIFANQDYSPEDLLKLGMLTAHYLTQGTELTDASAQARSDLKSGIADEVLEDLTDVPPSDRLPSTFENLNVVNPDPDPHKNHIFEIAWTAPNGDSRFTRYAARDYTDAVRGVIASDGDILASPTGKMFFSVSEAGSNHVQTIEAEVRDSGVTTFTPRGTGAGTLAPKAYDISWLGDGGSEHLRRSNGRSPVEAIRTALDSEAGTFLPDHQRLTPPDGGKRFLSVREEGTNRVTSHAIETHAPHSIKII